MGKDRYALTANESDYTYAARCGEGLPFDSKMLKPAK